MTKFSRKKIYLYPITEKTFEKGTNPYMQNLAQHLGKEHEIVNVGATRIGLLDVLLKIKRFNIVYLNWIEDLPERRFGILQIPVLLLIILLSKLLNKKIVWFVHNNLSHSSKNKIVKKWIAKLMALTADIILSHSKAVKVKAGKKKIFQFDHPIDEIKTIETKHPCDYDLLIWGSVSPYKGVTEFLKFNSSDTIIKDCKIVIAGKFSSESYYNEVKQLLLPNVTVFNKIVEEEELINLFQRCKCILFTYNSPSVLSSAALCKTLSYNKNIIGPNIGSFKDLGEKGLLFNYDSFSEIPGLLAKINEHGVRKELVQTYAEKTTWKKFVIFLTDTLN